MKFEGALFAVRSLAVSRPFYEDLLGCQVAMDLGTNLVYVGGPTLQEHFDELAGFPESLVQHKPHNAELYFESTDLDSDVARLKAANVEILHDIKEYPWGQRVFRFFDPDGHIIELGENMALVITRFFQSGMTPEEVAQRTGMPLEALTNPPTH